MSIPRDISGTTLVKALAKLGYSKTRQAGSHMRMTTQLGGVHHVTIPDHNPIKIGTFASILRAVAAHHKLTVAELLRRIEL